jgi:hypothetical protein
MPRAKGSVSVAFLLLAAAVRGAGPPVLEYPSVVLDLYDADESCWRGMDAEGLWRDDGDGPGVPVVPEQWLIGLPPSDLSAVTFPADHWAHLGYSGRIVDNDGNDIFIVESGRVGEQALIFLTDGADQEYVAGLAEALDSGEQALTHIEMDLAGIPIPFEARGLRVVAVDLGGGSPGFDLASIQARVSHNGDAGACCPNPLDNTRGVSCDVVLRWSPCNPACRQVIYFGEVESDVRSGASGVRHAVQPPDANAFTPPQLHLGRTYYWRVDEITDADVRPGDVWSFTVADRLVVDDFESYDLWDDYLYLSWPVRSWAWTSLDWNVIHSCHQSMLFEYHYDAVYFAETFRSFDPPQDWTRSGAAVLEVMLHGKSGNAVDGQLYLTLSDGTAEQFVPYEGDTEVLAQEQWHAWRIALDDFSDIDLTHVESMAIGLRPLGAEPLNRSHGTIYIDDIGLRPRFCPADQQPVADITGDCAVDYRDLEQMSLNWLQDGSFAWPVKAPSEPVLWYRFDDNVSDSAGHADGEIRGRPAYAAGVHGQALHFINQGDAVVVSDAGAVFSGIREALTIAFWQYGDDTRHVNDTVCCSNFVYGKSNPAIAVNLGLWRGPGQYRWDCGFPWSLENRLAGHHRRKNEWSGRWNHWVFTKDIHAGLDGRMEIYLNGILYASRTGADSPIANVTSFEIGTGWYGHYDGLIDEFQVYDYALSAGEAAYLATDGGGRLHNPAASVADLDTDDQVDLRDFTILAAQWLETALRP